MKIGENTVSAIKNHVEGLMREHLEDLDMAYRKTKVGPFSISFTSKLHPDSKGIKIETEIKYRPEPDVKDKFTGYVDDENMSLFKEDE